MSKKSLLKGAMWGTLAVFLSKVLGFIYLIPFNRFLDVDQQIVFTSSYRIYAYVLLIATAGIPFAVANLIARYNANNNYHISLKILKLTTIIMLIIGFICFIILFLFAKPLAYIIVTSTASVEVITHISIGIKIIALALIVVPLVSVVRGFFQGYQEIKITSVSQLVEQFINSGFIIAALLLAGGGLLNNLYAVYFAILCATIASIGSLIYLILKYFKLKDIFDNYYHNSNHHIEVSNKLLIKEILQISIPFIVVVLLAQSNDLIDLLYTINGLTAHGLHIEQAKEFSTIYGASVIKLMTIPLTLSTGISVALVPHLAEYYAKKDKKQLRNTILNILENTMIVLIPIVILMVATGYEVFYVIGQIHNASYGAVIFNYFAIYIIINTLSIIVDNMMLTLNQSKRALIFIIVATIFKLSATYFLIKQFGILGLALSSAIACLLSLVPSLIVLKNIYHLTFNRFFRVSIISLLCSLVMFVIVYIFKELIPNGNYLLMFIKTAILYIIGLGCYGLLAWHFKIIPVQIKNLLLRKLKRNHAA
ncbi:MAG: oligosaccharide flippase family protein [Bacilli bacterium]|jgi:O-antigen/teichoic acid export membrane protein|nr:oligosaccharide flippase family protein [Bacilli bacterium]